MTPLTTYRRLMDKIRAFEEKRKSANDIGWAKGLKTGRNGNKDYHACLRGACTRTRRFCDRKLATLRRQLGEAAQAHFKATGRWPHQEVP